MCTVCVWNMEDHPTLTARNMDWSMQMDTNLWVIPAGQHHRAGLADDPNVMEWTSKYGSIAAVSYGIGTADGMNEKGLTASALWLSESSYGARDEKVPAMAISLWCQYYLDNFATVEEAVQDYNNRPFQLVTADITPGRVTTIHVQISDASGDIAIFEVLDGQFMIHHGRDLNVLTNSPEYSEQISNLKRYAGFGGDLPLPGTTLPLDRFVRASYYLNALPTPSNPDQAIADILSVVRNAAQPYGTVDLERPNVAPTIWSSIADHSRLRYFFQQTTSPYPVWLDFKDVDVSAGAPVKMVTLTGTEHQLGNQSGNLVEKPLFKFKLD